VQQITTKKLFELRDQMPGFVDDVSSTNFVAATANLMDIVSYSLDLVNYNVYVSGEATLVSDNQGLPCASFWPVL